MRCFFKLVSSTNICSIFLYLYWFDEKTTERLRFDFRPLHRGVEYLLHFLAAGVVDSRYETRLGGRKCDVDLCCIALS